MKLEGKMKSINALCLLGVVVVVLGCEGRRTIGDLTPGKALTADLKPALAWDFDDCKLAAEWSQHGVSTLPEGLGKKGCSARFDSVELGLGAAGTRFPSIGGEGFGVAFRARMAECGGKYSSWSVGLLSDDDGLFDANKLWSYMVLFNGAPGGEFVTAVGYRESSAGGLDLEPVKVAGKTAQVLGLDWHEYVLVVDRKSQLIRFWIDGTDQGYSLHDFSMVDHIDGVLVTVRCWSADGQPSSTAYPEEGTPHQEKPGALLVDDVKVYSLDAAQLVPQ
jgi:hypothetical protein